jgi:hypothetical protein
MAGCVGATSVDTIAMQSVAALDSVHARSVFEQLEAIARDCDPEIAVYTESFDGLRSIFRGTVAPKGDCLKH